MVSDLLMEQMDPAPAVWNEHPNLCDEGEYSNCFPSLLKFPFAFKVWNHQTCLGHMKRNLAKSQRLARPQRKTVCYKCSCHQKWRTKAFHLTPIANLSNSFRASWMASTLSVFARSFYLGKFEFDSRVGNPDGTFSFIPKLHRSSWWWWLKCTQTLKRSVMVMLMQRQNLYHWDVSKWGLFASANAGHSPAFFSSSEFRVDLSYSLRDPLKDPHFNLLGPPHNFLLSPVLPSEGFTFQALLMKTEKVQKYIYAFYLVYLFIILSVLSETVQLCEPVEVYYSEDTLARGESTLDWYLSSIHPVWTDHFLPH